LRARISFAESPKLRAKAKLIALIQPDALANDVFVYKGSVG
jgi:hypothetical protein